MKEIIQKRGFKAVPNKQSTLEPRWHQMTDCSGGGFRPTEMHDCQQ